MSENGLQRHIFKNRTKPCGFWARKTKQNLRIEQRNARLEAIRKTKLSDFPNKPAISSSRPKGKPLYREQKEDMYRMYKTNLEDLKDHQRPEPAVSMTIYLLSSLEYLEFNQKLSG